MKTQDHNRHLKASSNANDGHVQVEAYAGLLPHPEILERYHALDPMITERILCMAESEAKYRQEAFYREQKVNEDALRLEYSRRSKGQTFAFATTCVLASAAVALGFFGLGTAAAIVGSSAVIGSVNAFLEKVRPQSQKSTGT